MAIAMIEYLEGIPFKDLMAGNFNMEQLLELGLMEGTLFGSGRKDNILPRGCQRFMSGVVVPLLVNADGTALISLAEAAVTTADTTNVPRVESVQRRDAPKGVFTEGGDRGSYRIISLPHTLSMLPFISHHLRDERLRAFCFGLLSHRPGTNPAQDTPLRSIREMHRALGIE